LIEGFVDAFSNVFETVYSVGERFRTGEHLELVLEAGGLRWERGEAGREVGGELEGVKGQDDREK